MRTRETLSLPKTPYPIQSNPIYKMRDNKRLNGHSVRKSLPSRAKINVSCYHGHSRLFIFFASTPQSSFLSSPIYRLLIIASQCVAQINGLECPEKKILRTHLPIEQRRQRGKYSDGPNPADEWFKRGKIVKAHPVFGSGKKAKDPFFGLTMGGGSQASDDVFRWFCVESGSVDSPPIILIHGFPSQAYSYRKVLPILSKDYHAIGFDWLGFGFSDKPQPGYGFDYTLAEYVSSLESLLNELAVNEVSLVVQGYFSPVVVKYASSHPEKLSNLILLNPPLTAKHTNLPSTLSIFSNFLLGEIFSQDPLRASDKALTSCGPYQMKEDDAMVYRRPYLTSGSSGFALNAISRAMKKELKIYVEEMGMILTDKNWKVQTTICWGQRDRWLSYDGVEDFCEVSKHRLIELPMAGHHVQEDCGEELGKLIAGIVSKRH